LREWAFFKPPEADETWLLVPGWWFLYQFGNLPMKPPSEGDDVAKKTGNLHLPPSAEPNTEPKAGTKSAWCFLQSSLGI